MNSQNDNRLFIMCLILGLVIMVTAATGVFFRGDKSSVQVTSVRGENYTMINTGIYQFNSQRMVAEGAGWDIFTLFIALPVFFFLLPFIKKGSLRARLLAIGLLAYFFYQYFMYAMAWAFGPMFPAFIIIYTFSLFLAIWVASQIDLKELTGRIEKNFPRKGIIVLCILVGLLLILMWSQRIFAGLRSDWETAMMYGQTTMVVQALDLGLIVPFAFVTAFLVWKRRPLGYLFSPILMVKAIAMAGAICFMLISAWMVENIPQVVPLIIFGTIFLSAGSLGYVMIKNA